MNSLSQRVVKAMGVFGGVQVVNIVCSIVRTKLVAIWLGSVGVGLFGVFNSAIDLVSQITMLGVGSSGTREMARSHDNADRRITIAVILRWCRWLAVGGGLLTFLAAPLLSLWSFGDTAHASGFRWLSLSVFFMGITTGYTAVLQGLSRFRRVASATLWGAIGGTLVAIPLFYWLRRDSIIPVIIATGAFLFIGAWFNRERELRPASGVTGREVLMRGRSLITLGAYITTSTVVTLLSSYVLISWFNSHHGSEVAGLYQAGFTIINRYVGLVFTAIAVEYFPRLAGVSSRRLLSEVFVSHEMKIALAVLVPLIGALTVFSPWVIELLYSTRFRVIEPFVAVGAVGSIFRAISWCMAFTMLVKGDGKIYLVTETLSGIFYVVLNIAVYDTLGIAGMGYAYLAWYALYALIVWIVYRRRYGMRLRPGIAKLALYSVLAAVTILVATMAGTWWLGAILTVAATAFSWQQLRPLLLRRK